MLKKLTIIMLLVSAILGTTVAMADEESGDVPSDDLANTQWNLSTIGGQSAILYHLVTLNFDDEGRVNGTGGCNFYNSDYTVDGDMIKFGLIASTRMMCMEDGIAEQETAFFDALESATRYEVYNDLLMIHYGDNQVLDLIRAVSLDNTQWELATLNQDGLVENSKITLQFDEEGNASGSAGCNRYGGSYTVSNSNMTFDALFSTEMACEEALMEQESAYLETLSKVNTHHYNTLNFSLILKTPDGGELWFNQVHDLLGTAWKLDSLGGQAVVGDRPVTLIFDEFDHAYGQVCNVYNSSYEVLGEGKIIFGIVTSTMMMCLGDDVMEQENAYQGALYGAYGYTLSDDQLIIHYFADDEEKELIFSPFATEPE